MTSYGVEFDTNLLVFLPTKKLPYGVKIKIPFFKDEKLEMTLETWTPEDKKNSVLDCLVSLEVQMGVFRSNDDKKFETDDFKLQCSEFIKKWNKIIDTKKIQIGDKEYDIVIYDKNGKFEDCGLSIKTNRSVGYTKDFFSKNAAGTPQITFGIRLPYVISIFAYISELYDKYNDPDTPTLTLYAVYLAYSTAGYYSAENGIKDLKIISLLMLISYYVNCNIIYNSESPNKKGYVKDYFAFKLRTNLRIIYDRIGKPKEIVKKFLESISTDAGEIISVMEKDFFNPVHAYVLTGTNKNLEIAPLSIVKNKSSDSFSGVDVFMSWWNKNLPEIVETDDTISYSKTPSNDFGEWTIGPNDTVYIEYRAIVATMSMIRPESFKLLRHLTAEKFCYVINYSMNEILGKALEIDPNIIIPPN